MEEALAGEKVQVEVKERPMGRLRGWFPRQCSVEKVEHDDRCMLRQSRTGRRKSRRKYDKGEATWPAIL